MGLPLNIGNGKMIRATLTNGAQVIKSAPARGRWRSLPAIRFAPCRIGRNLFVACPIPRPRGVHQYARQALAEAKCEIAIVGGIRGPFSSAWMLMGLEVMSFALF